MNRLTKDIYNVDKEIPNKIAVSISVFFGTFALFLQIFIISKLDTYPIIFLNIIIALVFAYFYRSSAREVQRIGNLLNFKFLEAVSKSPYLSFFSEIIRGNVFCKLCLKN